MKNTSVIHISEDFNLFLNWMVTYNFKGCKIIDRKIFNPWFCERHIIFLQYIT